MSQFLDINEYKADQGNYQLLPFRFSELDDQHHVITNLAGEFHVIKKEDLKNFANHLLASDTNLYKALRSKHFLIDNNTSIAKELLPIKLRTRYRRLANFTSLHLFVVTLRCEHSCPYCQVSRQSDDRLSFDMSKETAKKSIDLMMQSPSTHLKVEFQGGESLLNFEIVQLIVETTEEENKKHNKDIQFVIATNLAMITDEIIDYCDKKSIYISTSLDGPKSLHNTNRPRTGKNSYEKTIEGIEKVRNKLGTDSVSALMTTTFNSLLQVESIIDEYVANKFNGIFLRPLSPYGFAIKTKSYQSYDVNQWLRFYKKGLEYILQLNKDGLDFREYYAVTVLTKMLTAEDPGFVDLMSPTGAGIAAVVYNYDGDVYASDESRMLAEMGNEHFKIGNVHKNSYKEIFGNETLLTAIEDSFAYSCPQCTDCAYEPYCGSDPVFHFAKSSDYIGYKPTSEHCNRNMEIFKFLIKKMETDTFAKRLFTKWVNQK